MRAWIEKLSKISKEKGFCSFNEIITPNFAWTIYGIEKELYLRTDKKAVYLKIYDDEYDMLEEVLDYIKKKTEDEIIKLIEESE